MNRVFAGFAVLSLALCLGPASAWTWVLVMGGNAWQQDDTIRAVGRGFMDYTWTYERYTLDDRGFGQDRVMVNVVGRGGEGSDTRLWRVPLWPVAVLAAVPPAMWWVVRRRARASRPGGFEVRVRPGSGEALVRESTTARGA